MSGATGSARSTGPSVPLEVPTLADVCAAQARIEPYLRPTPLYPYQVLTELVGTEVWVKHENHQPVGAFKVRGGVNLVSQLSANERERGLITASTGNHGQSIAYAARPARGRTVELDSADNRTIRLRFAAWLHALRAVVGRTVESTVMTRTGQSSLKPAGWCRLSHNAEKATPRRSSDSTSAKMDQRNGLPRMRSNPYCYRARAASGRPSPTLETHR